MTASLFWSGRKQTSTSTQTTMVEPCPGCGRWRVLLPTAVPLPGVTVVLCATCLLLEQLVAPEPDSDPESTSPGGLPVAGDGPTGTALQPPQQGRGGSKGFASVAARLWGMGARGATGRPPPSAGTAANHDDPGPAVALVRATPAAALQKADPAHDRTGARRSGQPVRLRVYSV